MTRPLRIAHLTTVDSSLRYLLWAQLTTARDRGHHVIGISADGPDVAALEEAGIEHWPLRSSTRSLDPFADLRAARELGHLLRNRPVDVLHTHNPKPGIYGRIVGRLVGVPVIVNTVHGLYATETDHLAKRCAVYAAEAVASRFSDAELVQNEEDEALMRRLRLAPRRSLALLGNGIDLDRFAPGDRVARDELRRELGVGPDQVVVGIVARLVAEKGYPELFAAAEALPEQYVLVAIGPDDPARPDALPPEVRTRAAAQGVRLLGHREDVERWYHAFDVFVLPSHREGVPRAAMEAAACGLPIVATNIRGCRQIVVPGVNGELVPVGDTGRLRDAVLAVGDDATRRAAMGRASRQVAEERFDERAVVARVLQTYDHLSDRPADGRPATTTAVTRDDADNEPG